MYDKTTPSSSSQPRDITLPTLPFEVLDRIINFLPSLNVGRLRQVSTSLNESGRSTHDSAFIAHTAEHAPEAIKKFFPFISRKQLARIKLLIENATLKETHNAYVNLLLHPKLQSLLTVLRAQEVIKNLFPSATTEQLAQIQSLIKLAKLKNNQEANKNFLLQPIFQPLLIELQNQELEPLRQDITHWTARSQENPGRAINAFVKQLNSLAKDNQLAKIFLWTKTGNEQQLLKFNFKWLHLVWLLHIRDTNHLSLFDWATRNNLTLFLASSFNTPLCYVHLLSETDPLATIDSPLDKLYKATNLHWAIICQKEPEDFFQSHKEKVQKMALERVNTLRENAFHHAVRNIQLTWLHHLLLLTLHEPTLQEKLLDQKNNMGHTPLLTAANIGNWPAVALLLEHGASAKHLLSFLKAAPDTLPQAPRVMSPLHILAEHLNDGQLKSFIKSCPNTAINEPDPTGKTPLHFLSLRGEFNSVLFLLSHGADLTQTDDQGWSALHFAISSHNIKLINHLKSCLQQAGKHVLPTIKGRSIAHIAAIEGNERVINLFIEDITNLQIHDEDGHTPLSLAITHGKHESALHILQKMHPSIILPNHYLHLAAHAGFTHMDQLIKRVEDINQIDSNGNTALLLATLNGHVIATYHLLKSGAIIDIKNAQQQSPRSHVLKYKNPILMCLFELKLYEFNPIKWYAKKPSATKCAAIQALQEVVFNNADPTILIPHQTFLTPDGSKTVYKFYNILLPLINPGSQSKHSEAQATSSRMSSN